MDMTTIQAIDAGTPGNKTRPMGERAMIQIPGSITRNASMCVVRLAMKGGPKQQSHILIEWIE